MQPSPNHAPWQIAAVPTSGRVAAVALALLAVDSIFFSWSMTSMIESAALTIIPAVVAIRVIRGFPRSREIAAATLAAGVAVGLAALFRVGVGGQKSGAIVAAIVLAASGLLTLAWSWVLDRLGGQPVITMPRWPSAPVAVRSPSRYPSHRRYR